MAGASGVCPAVPVPSPVRPAMLALRRTLRVCGWLLWETELSVTWSPISLSVVARHSPCQSTCVQAQWPGPSPTALQPAALLPERSPRHPGPHLCSGPHTGRQQDCTVHLLASRSPQPRCCAHLCPRPCSQPGCAPRGGAAGHVHCSAEARGAALPASAHTACFLLCGGHSVVVMLVGVGLPWRCGLMLTGLCEHSVTLESPWRVSGLVPCQPGAASALLGHREPAVPPRTPAWLPGSGICRCPRGPLHPARAPRPWAVSTAHSVPCVQPWAGA